MTNETNQLTEEQIEAQRAHYMALNLPEITTARLAMSMTLAAGDKIAQSEIDELFGNNPSSDLVSFWDLDFQFKLNEGEIPLQGELEG